MNPELIISQKVSEAIAHLYGTTLPQEKIQVQTTRKEFEGDYTVVVFPLLSISKRSPEETAVGIGDYLTENLSIISKYNVVKGFLNLVLSNDYWLSTFKTISQADEWGRKKDSGKRYLVEYSSPNTNKPLHLGHIRNIILGWSVSRLLEYNGHEVVMVNLVNDRGVHICKSMLAWQRESGGETPQSSGLKGDHLVGKYYVVFNNLLKREIDLLVEEGVKQEDAERSSSLLKEAQEMLIKWERGDGETVELWKKMNGWVYDGFDVTYKMLGVSFDKIYYESETYLLGKKLVEEGLSRGLFFKKQDGSVWCDLTPDGLDEKLLLRSDGTSVYMTQDLGTAHQRYSEFSFDKHVYVVGNEQNYHFQVLKLILKKLQYSWADDIYHLSYGMVELPEGKMKSREGTVVDADDLINDMLLTAKDTSLELGKLESMSLKEQEELFKTLGLGALKYFILKVDPKKTMLFDPKESIDFNGNTGPFIQYTYARIKSILRKASELGLITGYTNSPLTHIEIEILKIINIFPDKIAEAGQLYSPSVIANYCYELSKEFNRYYHEVSILREENDSIKSQRLMLISIIADILKRGMSLLGIELPERM